MLAVMPQQTNPTRNPEIEITRMMSSRHEITEVVEEPPAQVAAEDKIYVAVGKELKENESTVLWALHNSGGRKICLLHVHEPAQWIPLTGTKFPVSQAEEHQVNAYRETNRLLRAYSMICERAGVSADVVHTGKDSIEKVIVELISQHGIKMLVLGAAADKCYSRKMTQTKSKKATYVRLQAPLFCRILFVCKGRLIHTREGGLEGSSLRSRSARERPTSSGPVYRRTSSFSSRGVMDNDSDLTSLVSSDPGSESRVLEGVMDCKLYDQLKKAMAEADNSMEEDFEESKRRRKAENDVIDAICRVNILSKLRHPNLVTLIEACPEVCILVYEYYPNGSLEDRLICKNNTPPLTWQTRIRIAAELCSVLVFFHSCNPHNIVHGDLKPANILIDANHVSKLGDFGICRVLTRDESSSSNTTPCRITNPKGTLVFMDPEFFSTGELTPKSHVYSFGIILLQLLTGRSAVWIAREVQYALDNGNLKNLLDSTAGDWPFVQAIQLAHLAIRCCERNRRNRPDLASEVWRVLEPMRSSCGVPSLFRMSSLEHCQIPSYFICPHFQEIMRDPHVAADGFTYELEALRGWLDSGNDTSPMTNLQLPHCNLMPNHALRSVIQEWLQRQPGSNFCLTSSA